MMFWKRPCGLTREVTTVLPAWTPAILLVALLVGCNSQDGPSKTSLFEDDHAIPGHWPNDLPDVGIKLRERLDGDNVTEQSMREISDLISWTPEVAADTELSESDWLPLYTASRELMPRLRAADRTLTKEDRQKLESFCQLITETSAKIPEPSSSP